MSVAIVIPCYNRPSALERLLNSVGQAYYENDTIPLIISVDGDANDMVLEMAKNFEWKFGPKEIIIQSSQLGLKEHIYFCGDLTDKYENIILLEDDLFVSPYFYAFAKRAIHFYKDQEKVAGISLYNYEVTENGRFTFKTIDDGSDVYFLQLASSWGQIFSKKAWTEYKKWNQAHEMEFESSLVPNYIKNWGGNSWKKHFIHYLINQDKYFVYPRLSLSTNFDDGGTHSISSNNFQTAIQNTSKEYRFQSFTESKAIYDASFEITSEALNKLTTVFANYNYEVDLFGAKESYNKPYVLTSQNAATSLFSFSNKMVPVIQNVLSNSAGTQIKFTQSSQVTIQPPTRIEKENISIVVPIFSYEEDALKTTLHSIFAGGYPNIHIVLVAKRELHASIEKLLVNYFPKNKMDFHLENISTNNIGDSLKIGFQKINSGIVSWIEPGNIFTPEIFVEANQVFSNYQQINWISVVDNDVAAHRFNLPVAFHLLSKKEGCIFPTHLFFRAHSWSTISAMLVNSQENYFFGEWLLMIVAHFDLHPMVVNEQKAKSAKKISLPADYLSKLNDGLTIDENMKSKLKDNLKFKILRSAYEHQTPGIKSLFAMYYDLPSVLRKDEKNGNYYLSKI